MLHRALPALLLAFLLVLPAATADGPREQRQERRQEAMERWSHLNETTRERGLERAEQHGLFARFTYAGGNATAFGRFVRFGIEPSAGSLQDVRVRAASTFGLTPLFASVTPSTYTPQDAPSVTGATLLMDGTGLDFTAHNNPLAAMTWRASAPVTVSFALAPSLQATKTDGHEAKILVGTTHAHIVSNGAANLTIATDGTTVTATLAANDTLLMRVHTLGDGSASGLHELISAFKAHRLGAFLRIADADGTPAEDGETGDVHASTRSIARGHIVWDVDSAQHEGRVLFLTLDNSTLDLARLAKVEARLNNTLLARMANIAEVVASQVGAYAIVPSTDGLSVTIAVAVPHFSSYALSLTQLGAGTTATGTSAMGSSSGATPTDGAAAGATSAATGTTRAPGLDLGILLLALAGLALVARKA
jgi:hypothetical protein